LGMRILALDTATEACSCALLMSDRLLRRDTELRKGHTEHILPMVDELLREAAITLPMLDAIAFGRGPGSFTGVRLAASVAQGLAFGAGRPVIGISDLRAVAQGVAGNNSSATRVLVCNDARMREVYWACFEKGLDGLMQLVGEEHVGPPSSVRLPQAWGESSARSGSAVQGAGRGFGAYEELRSAWLERLAGIDTARLPAASEIALLAAAELRAGHAVSPEEALPVYLRDDVAKPGS